ncbi:hypothetical protein EG329_001520 [Mollisiaceae sp. DMI_Dod_QoI]|nr:hypothetical protein EG329_001520 [Helotiales sp. DMI_Dod_QoI]
MAHGPWSMGGRRQQEEEEEEEEDEQWALVAEGVLAPGRWDDPFAAWAAVCVWLGVAALGRREREWAMGSG